MPLHDENFNRSDRVWMESELARRLMAITAPRPGFLDPVRKVVLHVSDVIASVFVKAYAGDADFRKNIHATVRSGGGVWFGRASGAQHDSEDGVGQWLDDVLVTSPHSYGIEHHLHLHQLFTEFWAVDKGFPGVPEAKVKELHKKLKPPEMFATRGRVPRRPANDVLANAVIPRAREMLGDSPLPRHEEILRKTLSRKLQWEVDQRIATFAGRDWLGIEHPSDRPRHYAAVQTHGSGMQTWRGAGADAKGKSPFIAIARDWLDMPLVGAASGSTADMLTTGYLLAGLEGVERRLYLLGVLAFVIGGGNHSFHEIASIARLVGVPYTAGSYASAIPRAYFSDQPYLCGIVREARSRLPTLAEIWKPIDLTDAVTCRELNFGKKADVSEALGGASAPRWASL